MYCEGLFNINRKSEQTRSNFYDMNFNLLDMKINNENITDCIIERPKNFEEMQKIAHVLSAPFPFCRVDLYNLDGRIIFGELTFYHAAGLNKIKPDKWEITMGEWLRIEKWRKF
jgi:hypothetical protein